MPLTDTTIRNAKPGTKPVRLFDGGGMYIEVSPAGGKLWRLKYRFDGKEKRLALGAYPEVGLRDARDRRDGARKLLAAGVDPGQVRKAEKIAKAEAGANTFEAIGREWMATKGREWSDLYAGKTKAALERHAFPGIGARPIVDLTAPDMLSLLRAIEKRGTVDMAHRVQQHCGAIYRYAVATGRAVYDPMPSLKGALATAKQEHYAAITDPAEFAQLLRDIDAYRGEVATKIAMQVMALTFQRTKEVRFAEWTQIDAAASLWRIPAEVMKMGEAHIVPLSDQALAAFEELRLLTGTGRLVFPSATNRERPISENTVSYALARMGYKGRMTGHGFRSTASTLLNEMGFRHDVIERQLAHAERNAVRAAYNRAEYLSERKAMMQNWADYLDKIKAGAEVVSLHSRAA